jgi:ABC-type oligopeptide transport system substrate-binding subunit
MDEKINKAKEKLLEVYEEGEKYELKLLKELEEELSDEKIKKVEDSLHKVCDEGEKFELEMLIEMKLQKIYEDGEKAEQMLMKQLNDKILKEKNTLTVAQQKQALQMGFKLADKMELDMLKSKYKKALENNGGIKNKKIEELIKNLEKKIF